MRAEIRPPVIPTYVALPTFVYAHAFPEMRVDISLCVMHVFLYVHMLYICTCFYIYTCHIFNPLTLTFKHLFNLFLGLLYTWMQYVGRCLGVPWVLPNQKLRGYG